MLENLPEPYRSKCKELLEKIENTPGREGKRKIFNDFVKNYTAIPDIWKLWIIQENSENIKILKEAALSHFFDENFLTYTEDDDDNDEIVFISRENRKFPFVISHPYFDCVMLMHDENRLWNEIDLALLFPHHYLKNVFYYFEQFGDYFPSKEKIEKLSILKEYYEKLMEAFDSEDIETWFYFLLQTENNDIIIQNMEYYIAKKPHQKQAWKNYIFFLRRRNYKAMLGVYSRYCRFFLDDNQMKQEYFEKVLQWHKSGKDVKIWFFDSKEILLQSNLKAFYDIRVKDAANIDVQNFTILKTNYEEKINGLEVLDSIDIWFRKEELNFLKTFDTKIFLEEKKPLFVMKTFSFYGNFVKNNALLDSANKDSAKEICKLKWNNLNMKSQNFAFHKNILYFISKNYKIRQKLYQCCKYFYANFQTPLCYALYVTEKNKTEFKGQQLYLSSDVFDKDPGSNVVVGNESTFAPFLNLLRENMTITTSLNIFNPLNATCFTQVFKMFKKIHIKYLALGSQKINLQDLILLNQSCNLISCRFSDVDVLNPDGKFSTLDDVLFNLPTLEYFSLKFSCPNLEYTSNTAKNLGSMYPKRQFKEFVISNAKDELHSIDFCNFLKTQTSNNCKFVISFNNNLNDEYKRSFFKTVFKYLDNWTPKHYAPSFLLSSSSFPQAYDPLP